MQKPSQIHMGPKVLLSHYKSIDNFEKNGDNELDEPSPLK